jgi:hypothetical protein
VNGRGGQQHRSGTLNHSPARRQPRPPHASPRSGAMRPNAPLAGREPSADLRAQLAGGPARLFTPFQRCNHRRLAALGAVSWRHDMRQATTRSGDRVRAERSFGAPSPTCLSSTPGVPNGGCTRPSRVIGHAPLRLCLAGCRVGKRRPPWVAVGERLRLLAHEDHQSAESEPARATHRSHRARTPRRIQCGLVGRRQAVQVSLRGDDTGVPEAFPDHLKVRTTG